MVELPKMPKPQGNVAAPSGLPLMPKKKDVTELSGANVSSAGKSDKESDSSWYDWDNIKKFGSNLIGGIGGLAQEIPSETTRLIGDTISALGLAVDLGGRYTSAGINYLSGNKKQAQKDIDSDPTFLGKYIIEAGNYLSESADQTKDDTLKKWGVSDKNRSPQRSFYDAFSDGDLMDGSAMLFRDVLATVPQVIAASMTGGGSLEAQALRTGATGLLKESALAEMGSIASTRLPSLISQGMKSTTGAQFKFGIGLGTTSSLAEEYKKDNHITATDFVESFARGVVEGVSETLFDSDIIAAKKLASNFIDISNNPAVRGIMSSIASEGEDEAREKIIRTTGDILKKTFAGGKNEGFEEVASSFGNMLIDATKNGGFTEASFNKFKKDAVESFIVGALSGGTISGYVAKESRVKLTDEQQKTIDRYNEVANNDALSDDARNIARQRIKDILDYNADLNKNNYRLIAGLPQEKRAEALDYLYKMNQLEEDKRDAKDLAPEIDSKINEYESKVNDIILGHMKSTEEEMRKAKMTESEKDTEDIVNLFQLDEEGNGTSIEALDNALSPTRSKMNAGEEVNLEEANQAKDLIWGILEKIDKSSLTDRQKRIAQEPYFSQIDQLDSYEKTVAVGEVSTPILETTTTTREVGRIERPKTSVTAERFEAEPIKIIDKEGKESSFTAKVDDEGGITLKPKVRFTRTSTQEIPKSIKLDVNRIQFQESIKDENDRVIGAKLLDTKTGNTLEISNADLATDLATRAKQEALGNVSEGVMETTKTNKQIGEVRSIAKEFINKRKPSEQVAQEPIIEEVTTTETQQLPTNSIEVDDTTKTSSNKIINKFTGAQRIKLSNVNKALKSIMPDVKMVVHDNAESFKNALMNAGYSEEQSAQVAGESSGVWDGRNKVIHVNSGNIAETTIVHEAFHAIVSDIAQNNPEEFSAMRDKIISSLKDSDSKALQKFADQYAKSEQAEEFLAELAALIANNKVSFNRNILHNIAMAIKEVVKRFAKRINSKALDKLADSMFTEASSREDLLQFFEGFKKIGITGKIDDSYLNNILNKNLPNEVESLLRQSKKTNIDEAIVDAMNSLGGVHIDTDIESIVSARGKLDLSTFKDGRDGIVLQPNIVKISDFTGKPILVTISDELRVGDIKNPITGQNIDRLNGGLFFNFSEGNTEYAWAYTAEKNALDVLNEAKKLYKKNPELYTDKIVPVAVVKMGKKAMASNEAIIRQVIQNLSGNNIPKENKKNALAALIPDIQNQLDVVKKRAEKAEQEGKEVTASDKAQLRGYPAIMSLVKSVKTFDELLSKIDTLNIGVRPLLIDRFTTGNADIVPEINRMSATTPVGKALMEGLGKQDIKRINLGNLVSNLAEPALKNVPDKHIISFVGVDITADSAIKSDTHPNYPYVLKGKGLGVVEDTMHIASVMPTAYGNVLHKMIEAEASNKKKTEASIISAGLPAGMSNTSFKGKVINATDTSYNKLLGYLNLAFPNVNFFVDQQVWESALSDNKVKKYSKDGNVTYGLTEDGHIYINPDYAITKTPIHEMGHIWLDLLENSSNELFNKGTSLVEGTKELEKAIKEYGDSIAARKEALSVLIGNRGDSIVDAAKKASFKEWLVSVYKYVKEFLPTLRGLSTKQIQKLTLDDFVDGAVKEILGGAKPKLKQQKAFHNALEDSDKEYKRKFSSSYTVKGLYRVLAKNLYDRMINARRAMEDAGLDTPMYLMYTKAGASMFGNLKFTEAFNRIYAGLDEKKQKALNNILFLKRVIAIDENFDNRIAAQENEIKKLQSGIASMINSNKELNRQANMALSLNNIDKYNMLKGQVEVNEKAIKSNKSQIDSINKDKLTRPSHTSIRDFDGNKITTNKESAEEMLTKYRLEIGDELFDELEYRAELYFEEFSNMLKYKYDNGLIDLETYKMYKNYSYIPRKFLEYTFGRSLDEMDVNPNMFYGRGVGVTGEEVKMINEGSEGEIMTDSAKLLQLAMIATEVRVANNKALKALYEDGISQNLDWLKEVNYKRTPSGQIKIKEDGTLDYNTDANKGFRIVKFKENGITKAFQLEEKIAKEFFDDQMFNRAHPIYKLAQTLTGANLVRMFATGINPAFVLSNIPIDVISQVQINDLYANGERGIASQYSKAFGGTVKTAYKLITDKNNKELQDLIHEYAQAGGLMMTLTEEFRNKNKFLAKTEDFLGAFGSASELGSKLTAYSSMKETLINQYNKENGAMPTGEALERIKTEAAFKARAAMDYHRGGLVTKWVDGFVPYLNVLTQSTAITARYIKNNPKEFTKKIIETGLFIAALTILNMAIAGDDYDNDDNQDDLMKKIVIFAPYKNEDGTRGKVEISVPLPIKAFLNVFQVMGEGIYYKMFKGEDMKVDDLKAKSLQRLFSGFEQLVSSNLTSQIPPSLKSIIEYGMGVDLWRGRDIAGTAKNILPETEGLYDDKITNFNKLFGKATGLSPARMQKVEENFFVPSNPLIAGAYSLMDKMINTTVQIPKSQQSKYNNNNWYDPLAQMGGKIIGRLYTTTDPSLIYNKKKDVVDEINKQAGSKTQEVKAETKQLFEDKASVAEYNKYILSIDEPYRKIVKDTYETMSKRDAIKNKSDLDLYLDIKYAVNAEAKAKLMYVYFPDLLENKETQHDLKVLGLGGDDVRKLYTKYYNQKGIEK